MYKYSKFVYVDRQIKYGTLNRFTYVFVFKAQNVGDGVQNRVVLRMPLKRFQNGSFSVTPAPGVNENSFSVFSCPPLIYRHGDTLYKMWQMNNRDCCVTKSQL